MQQIIPQDDKRLSLLNNGDNKTDVIHLFVNFLKKNEKNVIIVINDGEHTLRIKDGASPLQLFSCNHEEADSRMAQCFKIQWKCCNCS